MRSVSLICFKKKCDADLRLSTALRATVDISSGTEIVVSYWRIDSFDSRRLKQGDFGFECRCRLCSLPPALQLGMDLQIARLTSFVTNLPTQLESRDPVRLLLEVIQVGEIMVEEQAFSESVLHVVQNAFILCCWFGDVSAALSWGAIWRESMEVSYGRIWTIRWCSRNPRWLKCWGTKTREKGDASSLPHPVSLEVDLFR